MRYILIFLFVASATIVSFGQKSRLANQYYYSGEYEKAAMLYKQLHKKSPNSDHYFNRYIEALLATEEYSIAEKEIKQQIKKRPKDVQLLVTSGNLYEKLGDLKKANEQYRTAIDRLPNDMNTISRIANGFSGLAKYDLAIETLNKGGKVLGKKEYFAYKLAQLYSRKGESEKMVDSYLDCVPQYKSNLNNLISLMQRTMQDDDYEMLQTKLYERIDDDPDLLYHDLLAWTFIHRKEYKKAFRQARAIDRKNEENGGRVLKVADIAYNDKDYDTAIAAYEYISENKGKNSNYYLDAKRGLLNSRRKKITATFDYSTEDIQSLKSEYLSFLEEFGKNYQSAELIIELADLEALYLNHLDTAILHLTELVDYPGVTKPVLFDAKIKLADYLLMSGDIWESTLLYSQVDKAQKEGSYGEIARYKNALLSYYNGDFEWAQEQFKILKLATSRLISNDAIDRAVFIMDNLGLDTTAVPMTMFAQAELLTFQNRYDEAFAKWDSIETVFPEHGLKDDILYEKAKIYVKQKAYDKAVKHYEQIIADFKEEIRADNALLELGELYEGPLEDVEKAKSLYEKVFIDYPSSTFAVEARNRFRILRGDTLN